MGRRFEEKVHEWSLSLSGGQAIVEAHQQVQQLAVRLFDQYEPTRGPRQKFWDRLNAWLNSVPDENEQRTLFQLVPHLFFLGPKEMDCMYRVAFKEHMFQWLVDTTGIGFEDSHAAAKLKSALRETWVCPVTDSMRINAFYHLNNLAGRDFRPDWRSLALLGEVKKIASFITKERVKRLVLLEDFVGSGSQVRSTLRFAATLPGRLPVLFIPLVVCPAGDRLLANLASVLTNFTYRPVLRLPAESFLSPVPALTEPAIFGAVRAVVLKYYAYLLRGTPARDRPKLYGPFGFDSTGGLVVIWTNCPDNTLPAIHHRAPNWWSPLFPRASRI
jgi:hypothetical protein